MADVEHDLGPALSFEADAIGLAGQRTFRLRLVTAQGAASLRLEKEQVRALATAVEQGSGPAPPPDSDRARPAPPPLRDFPLHPPSTSTSAASPSATTPAPTSSPSTSLTPMPRIRNVPTLRTTFTRDQARLFTVQSEAAVASGRPTCPLCKEPLDDEHFCPPANGHSHRHRRLARPARYLTAPSPLRSGSLLAPSSPRPPASPPTLLSRLSSAVC